MRWIVLIGAVLTAGTVQADEISGDWCSPLGAHLRIERDEIITPGGQRTHGVYGRHSYEFIMPEGEEDAGLIVRMRQLLEERMIVTYEGRDPVEWGRCQAVS